jgi:uncharacterized protein YyaL (SSP411 family)
MLAFYEATFDENYVVSARKLADYAFAHFYDGTGFFRFTSDLGPALVAQHHEVEDNVIPASNSVLARCLLKLSVYFEDVRYADAARDMLDRIFPSIDYPAAFSNWLSLLLDFSPDACQVAVCGTDARRLADELLRLYLPQMTLAGTDAASRLAFLNNRLADPHTLIYVCRGRACHAPSRTVAQAVDEIGNGASLMP